MDVEIVESEIVDVLGDQGLLRRVLERRPAVVAMTLYVWNAGRSLFLAANIKRHLAGTKIVVGGPEVTPDNSWVMRHPAVDAGVFGEGESSLAQVLETLLREEDLNRVPGIFFREDGEPRITRGHALRWCLNTCVYPYLNGRIAPSRQGTVFLETVRGCPFRCRYCYYHKAFSGLRFHPRAAVEATLDFAYDSASTVREIYLMDPTFNARPGFRDLLRSMARRRAHKEVKLHTELRADLLSRDDATLFQDAGLASAEVGLQTIEPEALREAGRKGDPDKMARGVNFLKDAAVEVTTGVILGLPRDTPAGFRRTLDWLQKTQAYSVVHPFVLSVLPGTDFRASAERLGLRYDPRPPYYVRSTPSFPEDAFRTALLECESAFDMELDYIAPPSLVDSGPEVTTDPARSPYLSTWIVDLTRNDAARALPMVVARSTDPFVFWFRGRRDERRVLWLLRGFATANPYTCLHVVLEFPEIPGLRFFDRALEATAFPGHYVNRSFWPLYPDGEIVSVNFWIVHPDPQDSLIREHLEEEYLAVAGLIWDTRETDPDRLTQVNAPLLFSGEVQPREEHARVILRALQQTHGDHPEQILFRNAELDEAWCELNGRLTRPLTFPECILSPKSI
jgi:hypothetical protein